MLLKYAEMYIAEKQHNWQKDFKSNFRKIKEL